MHFFQNILDVLKNVQPALQQQIEQHGPWTYVLLFAIVFAETGLVVTPFLPGDTLLFAAGLLSNPDPGKPGLNILVVLIVLTLAPICGDNVNYHLGKWLGPWLFRNDKARFLKRSNLKKTEEFFDKHGGKAIILARWVPVVRTFAPFVAGMGAMPYAKFLRNSIIGAILWVWICVSAGYLFGRNPWVKEHFEVAMLAMIGITVIPLIVEGIRHRIKPKAKKTEGVVTTKDVFESELNGTGSEPTGPS